MDELTKIAPSAFGPFIGHHQGFEFKNRTLSTEIEYNQEIWNIFFLNLKALQNIVAIFKINSIDFRIFLYVEFLGFVVVAYQFCVL